MALGLMQISKIMLVTIDGKANYADPVIVVEKKRKWNTYIFKFKGKVVLTLDSLPEPRKLIHTLHMNHTANVHLVTTKLSNLINIKLGVSHFCRFSN